MHGLPSPPIPQTSVCSAAYSYEFKPTSAYIFALRTGQFGAIVDDAFAARIGLLACTGGASDGGKDSPFRLYIDGYEWGAGVYKIVMDFGGEVGGNLQESLQLTTSSGSRRSEVETVSAYNCDEEGNRADTAQAMTTGRTR